VARYGGEEFVMLLPDTPREGATHVATRILAAVAAMGVAHAESPTAAHVTVSVGLSYCDETTVGWVASPGESRYSEDLSAVLNAAGLLQAADKALYAAKLAGRAQAWMLDPNDVDVPSQAREIPLLSLSVDVGAAA
jgi:diguanylate cyclase (GGDEF)-like protein